MSVKLILTNQSQTTLAKAVSLSGMSVLGYGHCEAEILPAPADHGIVLEVDGVKIPATYSNVVLDSAEHTTTLRSNGTLLPTVEHLLGALHGLGIDNVLIKTSKLGIPFQDFSAEYFTRCLVAGGRQELTAKREALRITEPFRIGQENDDRFAEFTPTDGDHLIIDCITHFPDPIGRIEVHHEIGVDDFPAAVAWARSFVPRPLDDAGERWARVRQSFPILPADPKESPLLVFNDRGPITPLRSPDEFGWHKLLDFLGDIRLAGWTIAGHVKLYKPGHSFNRKLAGELLSRIES